ncbi:unnamed protein product [Notodromas monacha]|uniref:DIRP domain-containing protein n=1 Tax=Notodromas monacha TaxID=399045 RepID=A0A7R9BEG2_9CRUS|nr:unnamed protein product [Notodromas monacha]CAG0913182.1 unnamed protein product [Notodromas monacha]
MRRSSIREKNDGEEAVPLNNRGTPARIRKPNRALFDGDFVEVNLNGKKRRPADGEKVSESASSTPKRLKHSLLTTPSPRKCNADAVKNSRKVSSSKRTLNLSEPKPVDDDDESATPKRSVRASRSKPQNDATPVRKSARKPEPNKRFLDPDEIVDLPNLLGQSPRKKSEQEGKSSRKSSRSSSASVSTRERNIPSPILEEQLSPKIPLKELSEEEFLNPSSEPDDSSDEDDDSSEASRNSSKYSTYNPLKAFLPKSSKNSKRFRGVKFVVEDEKPKMEKTVTRVLSKEERRNRLGRRKEVLKQSRISMKVMRCLKRRPTLQWVAYEWFYGHVDVPIFFGDNPFLTCLRENFPKLLELSHGKVLKMTRTEWNFVRKRFGKPRRFSAAFLEEERAVLEIRRDQIRTLQAREIFDFRSMWKCLPDRIPLPLCVGMEVIAFLPALCGFHEGVIQAVNGLKHTFRIRFNNPRIGCQTVDDIFVARGRTLKGLIIPLNQYLAKIRRPRNASASMLPIYSNQRQTPRWRQSNPGRPSPIMGAIDPSLAASDVPLKAMLLEGNLTQFPLQSLVNIVRVKKLLDIKHAKIAELKELNHQAEVTRCHAKEYSIFFQRKYSTLILDLERLNSDLNVVLKEVNNYCRRVAPEQFPKSFSLLKDVTMSQAKALVSSYNVADGDAQGQRAGPSSSKPSVHTGDVIVDDSNVLQLITRVLALFLQIKSFADSSPPWNSYDLRALTDTISEAKANLQPENVALFESCVEVQIRQVLAAMSQSKQATSGLEESSSSTNAFLPDENR